MTNVLTFTESIHACGAPPKIPHALVIQKSYQEVFAEDSKVHYQCKDGYTVEGADDNTSIFCLAGKWTEGPTCSKWTVCLMKKKPLTLNPLEQCLSSHVETLT